MTKRFAKNFAQRGQLYVWSQIDRATMIFETIGKVLLQFILKVPQRSENQLLEKLAHKGSNGEVTFAY